MNENHEYLLSRSRFRAVIFDLDGVVTETAKVHAEAWKRMFDEFLKARGKRPFDPEADYKRYVDGKPRFDGIKSFLASRGIELPLGSPSDSADQETVCGLGNRKNRLFQDLLQEKGVSVYDSTVKLIRRLRSGHFVTAVISSSKNCGPILETAGISHLFDVSVDGVDAERMGIAGKPAPEIFLEAADRLKVAPEQCVVVEDSIAGVQAGKRGEFGLVVGIDRAGRTDALRKEGADIVVKDLSEIDVADKKSSGTSDIADLPSALEKENRIEERLHGRRPAVFLDYDGTLTPIVDRPEDALLTYEMKKILQNLASFTPVAIISGRGMEDVESRVGLSDIIYAGSHGFEIKGPDGLRLEHPEGEKYLQVLDRAASGLKEELADIAGALVERKKYAIAVHYRQVDKNRVDSVEASVRRISEQFPELLLYAGKKVFEIRPDIDWDKGKAVRWIMEALDFNTREYLPMYIGDDTTDEDAFRELADDGIGILVAEDSGRTAAHFVLLGIQDVRRFLELLTRQTD